MVRMPWECWPRYPGIEVTLKRLGFITLTCDQQGLTCFDGSQPLQFPPLECFQRFFNTFLETKPLSVKSSNSNAVSFVSCISLLTKPDIGRLRLCIGVQGLSDDVHEVVRALDEVICQRCKVTFRRRGCSFGLGAKFKSLGGISKRVVTNISTPTLGRN